jgi:misacylated tRNA(Ala) deacylase
VTELLYADDSYLTECDAVVTEVRDGTAVVLDRTVFYPTGGGQPHDLGTLRWDGGEARVMEVRKQGPDVLHLVEGAVPPVGARVHGEIDWERRYRLMRHHTALHAMSGVIYQLFGSTVTGGQMYPDRARMDFALPDLSPEKVAQIEATTNRLLAEGRPIHVTSLPREQALEIPDLIRTKVNLIPEAVRVLRIIDIEGIDMQADGGTHVRNTREVGPVRVVKTENKGKENKRLEIALDA